MILALKKNSTPAQEETLLAYLHQMGATAAKETCRGCTVLLLEGAVENLDAQLLSSLPAVEAVLPLDEPPAPVLPGRPWGGHRGQGGSRPRRRRPLLPYGGPCAVESQAQLLSIARSVRSAGAMVLRGRRLQAPHLPLRLLRPAKRGPDPSFFGPPGDGSPRGLRNYEPRRSPPV
ncbi:MAG: hypothetical protein ACLUNQ_08420 [Oscillospiraceae bacterium]